LGNPGGAPSLLVGVIVNQIVFWLVQALVRKRSPEGWFAPIDAETGTTRPIEA
jgi:hypothetical protein